MSLRTRIIKTLGGELPSQPPVTATRSGGQRRSFKSLNRAYKAASQDRITADWLSVGLDLNYELQHQLPILRTRARELEQNSNIARRYFGLTESHIVGHDGFRLQVLGKKNDGTQDSEKSKIIQDNFKRWSRKGVCDSTGKFSFASFCRLSVRTAARDGECLIRLHDVAPTRRNPWGLLLESLDPARLDHLYNDDLKNGNRVRLGVELAPSGRPVAYWLRIGERPGWFGTNVQRERVPAENIIHWFIADRPEQLRGPTWMASAMMTIHQLDEYQEAAIVASRAGASKMGFYTQQDAGMGRQVLADDQDEDGTLYEEFDPGHFGILPKGYGFTPFDPKYPAEAYDPFVRALLRDIASGLNVSYHALTGDLTDVNYSSIRSGTLEERQRWMVLQEDFASTALEHIYQRWLSNAVMHDCFGNVSQEEFIALMSDHKWQGRRWQWIDPVGDIESAVAAINAGLSSPQRIAAENGIDIDQVIVDLAEWKKKVEKENITFPVINTKAAASKAA